MTGSGCCNAEIATELYLGEATVKTHLTNLLGKIGARDRVQAVVVADESGLVRPGAAGGGAKSQREDRVAAGAMP